MQQRFGSRRLRGYAAAVLAITATFLVTACASAGGEPPAASPTESGDATDLHSLLPAAIQEKGQIDVISTFTYPPWHVVESDGTASGLNGELSKALGEKLDITFHHKGVEYTSLIPSLLSGHADIIWDSLHDTKERQKELDFLDFVSVGSAFLVQNGNPADLSDMDSLCGNKLTLTQSQSQITKVEAQQQKCQSAGLGEIEVLTLPNNAACVIAVQTGQADAFLNDKVALTEIARTTGGDDLEVVSADEAGFDASPVGIGVKKGNQELLNALQAGLQALMDDGTYLSILEANGMAFAALESAEINQAVN
jgi:polar amino acid transport system substrate-binding protein